MITDKAPDSQKGKRLQGFSCFVRLLSVLFLAVNAPVDFRVFVCQIEYVRQFLLSSPPSILMISLRPILLLRAFLMIAT